MDSKLIMIITYRNSFFSHCRMVFTKIDGSCRRDELRSCDRSFDLMRSRNWLFWAIADISRST
ncbi:hypothetical protein [Microcoleus sp. bin38.metabat.b11b12b14.051]|uniref:hypothetical protein n=1 Tax=Microcoleus sp. bin38.metabat.b11b12b14.051 TaxID=2742709 RepID=UPI0025CCED4F|nr:hypothetical protein [Microcoleus sp. bin38.metabat.b11b12b14.051]